MARPSYKEFTHKWVENLIDSIDAHLDEETRIALMESCGRACARRGPVYAARECQGDLDAWLARLAKWHGGEEHVQRHGDVVRLTCTQCLCDLVKDGPERLPDNLLPLLPRLDEGSVRGGCRKTRGSRAGRIDQARRTAMQVRHSPVKGAR